MHGANILPKPARFGCTAAICCQEGVLFPSDAPSGTHEAKKPPRIAARKRTAAISCHCRTLGNAFREHFAIGDPPKTHHGGMLPRPAARERIAAECCHGSPPGNAPRRNVATAGCSGDMRQRYVAAARRMLPLPVGAVLARCRDEGAGGARGSIDPSAASGASALRPSIGTRAAVFSGSGGTAQPARCRVRLSALIAGAWGPLGRSWVATTARTFIAGARAPFSGLMRGVASSLRCFGGQPWARFAFCGAVPYHVLKQNAL